ncbi:DNA-3-methyladenine glycosylase [Dyadobacter beijingensis]|uniref:DNA-3-methyladenine glycosylase II n=1 Tax=Dyadobacter beijingensis TaxID=365489 RepID=A0ABQ2HWS0_9BACT|nr:DNA-3-methyladenine glycosylase [Dyadobacter beijingensis]GGM91579.1 DNA-3-methyladenine glycosylase [Dyadobacter beijingensis]
MDSQQTILVPVPPIFSFRECLWFLNRNYDDCLHWVTETAVFKAIATPYGDVLFRVSEQGNFLKIDVLEGVAGRESRDYLTAYVSDWFDLDRDLLPFYAQLKQDGRLGYMADSFFGLRLMGISDVFEALCWSIIGQQINLKFAYKMKRRMVERYGRHIEWNNQVFHIFPGPEVLANADVEVLREMQFSQKKAEYVIGAARAFVEGTISRSIIEALPDFEARQKALVAHKGIGVWTANYVLMKSFRAPEGIPHGDVGLLNALVGHGVIAERSEKAKIEAFFKDYPGWETYVTFYLWRSLAVKPLT